MTTTNPGDELVFVEPGLAWVAWWLHVVDDMVLRQGYEFPGLMELPSFYFHRNVHLTFIEEDFSLDLLRDRIGVANAPEDATLADVLSQVSPSRLPDHPFVDKDPEARLRASFGGGC